MNAFKTSDIEYSSENRIQLNQYITVRGAAVHSGYNCQYLRRLLRAGSFQAVKIGQIWLIRLDSLDAYLQNNHQKQDHRCGPKNKRKKKQS
jgi:excisionase family DNA binding protein